VGNNRQQHDVRVCPREPTSACVRIAYGSRTIRRAQTQARLRQATGGRRQTGCGLRRAALLPGSLWVWVWVWVSPSTAVTAVTQARGWVRLPAAAFGFGCLRVVSCCLAACSGRWCGAGVVRVWCIGLGLPASCLSPLASLMWPSVAFLRRIYSIFFQQPMPLLQRRHGHGVAVARTAYTTV
jgi:hypothetical protein